MIVWRLNGILIGPPSSDCCATVTAVGHARAYDDEEACVEWWESVPHVGGGADPVEVGWGEGRFWVAIKLILIEVFSLPLDKIYLKSDGLIVNYANIPHFQFSDWHYCSIYVRVYIGWSDSSNKKKRNTIPYYTLSQMNIY